MFDVSKRSWISGELGIPTLHTGLYFPHFGKFGLLVVNLPHGLRAIRIKGSAEFNFFGREDKLDGSKPEIIELYEEALKALKADEKFQRQTKLVDELVKNI